MGRFTVGQKIRRLTDTPWNNYRPDSTNLYAGEVYEVASATLDGSVTLVGKGPMFDYNEARFEAVTEPGPPFATPAPLDPSKVKAGDMVAVDVDYDRHHLAPFSIKGEAYSTSGHGGRLSVGGWGLDHPAVTLTDHQPAPEPKPTLPTKAGSRVKVGSTIYLLTERGDWVDVNNGYVRCQPPQTFEVLYG